MLKAGFRKCHRRPKNRLPLGCELRCASSSFRWVVQMRFFLGVQTATKHCMSRYHLHTVNAALLLIAKKNVHLKLKRDRGGVHEINVNVEDSMVNITTFSLNWKQMGNGFFSILEWILRRSPTFWGRLKIKRCTRNTIYHMIYYIIIIYKCGPCPVFDELYPGICLTTEEKTRKNLS